MSSPTVCCMLVERRPLCRGSGIPNQWSSLSHPLKKAKICGMIIIVYTMQLLAADVQIYSYMADLY